MICPRCNNQVADGIKFCGSCGNPMQSKDKHHRQQAPRVPMVPQSQNPYGSSAQGPYSSPSQGAYTPPNQYEEYSNSMFGNSVPKAELHNPKGPLRVADMTITIDGELVPVVDIMLGNQMPIYFEHHILLWKHPGVQINFKSLRGRRQTFLRRTPNLYY